MSKLSIDVENLQSAGKTLNQVVERLNNVEERINTLLQELDSTWDGAASAEFLARLRKQIQEMRKSISAVQGIQQYSENTAEVMERLDQIINALRKFI